MSKIGIYKIECVINQKKYIGQSLNIEIRGKRHLRELSNNCHWNTHLQHSFNKYGIDNFLFEIIEECTKDELNEKEMFYIKHFKSYNREFGFNLEQGGNFNKTISEETKIKISQSMKGVKKSLIVREKMSISQKKRSKEISKQHTGNSYTKGIKRSQDFKDKISKSLIGNKRRLGLTPINTTPVIQYDVNMNFIKEWDKFSDLKKTFGYNHSNLIKCCKGEIKKSYGYIWRYKISQ